MYIEAYRLFWRAYGVILLMLHRLLTTQRPVYETPLIAVYVLMLHWATHTFLCQLYLWHQAERGRQGRELGKFKISAVDTVFSLGISRKTITGARWALFGATLAIPLIAYAFYPPFHFIS